MSSEDASKVEEAPRAVDMRSDTVTKPTDEMRAAMAAAPVGDDVYGDDPTVNQLQELAAKASGKEAALFVSSGTMGNLLSILCHCSQNGSEFICGDNAHIYYYEGGGSASLAGAHPRPLPNRPDGTINLEQIKHCIREDDAHFPKTRMIALETTHNRKGGQVLSLEYIDAVATIARENNLKLHMDGARIFNAATALGVPMSRIVEKCDSVTFCLSKALGAPAGSMLCGTKEFIYHAHRWRKALGGGMRQVGVLAAPGIIALRDMPAKIAGDHARAQALAAGLAKIDNIECDVDSVKSNLVMFSVAGTGIRAPDFCVKLRGVGVLMGAKDSTTIRAAIHHQVSDEDVATALRAVAALAASAQ